MSSKARMSKRIERYYRAVLEHWDLTDWLFVQTHYKMGRKMRSAYSALLFIRNWGGREGVDLARLQNIVALDPRCSYELARDFPWANVRKLEMTVIRKGSPELMRTFAANIRGARSEMLLEIALEREVTRDVLAT